MSKRTRKVTPDDFGVLEDYASYTQSPYVCEDCGGIHGKTPPTEDSIIEPVVELPGIEATQSSDKDKEIFRQMQYHLQQSRYHLEQSTYHKEQMKRLATITPQVCFPTGALCREDSQCCGGQCRNGQCIS